MQRGSVVIYRSFMEALESVPERSYKRIMNAVLRYAMDGVEPKLQGLELGFFLSVKNQIDANNRKFENGKQGGRPTNQSETTEEPNGNQTETKAKPNDNQTITKDEPSGNQSETTEEPNDNLPRARMRNEKCNMRNENILERKKERKEEEKEIINNNCARETYDDIFNEMGVKGAYKEAMVRFIRHLKANHNVVMLNERLSSLIVHLDMNYESDADKIQAIDYAILCNYTHLKVEEINGAYGG